MAEGDDTGSNEQKAVAKGKGSLAINAAKYANVTVYQPGQEQKETTRERINELAQKHVEDANKLEEEIREFVKNRRTNDEVYILSQKAANELESLNIERAKISIELASETQVHQNLMQELSSYSSLKLMWGRAELLDGEIDSAKETFLSIGSMLKHFSPLEAARYLKDAGRTCFNHGQSYGGPALWHSVDIFKRASRYIRRKDDPQEWAKIKNYLGESYRLLGRRNVGSQYHSWLDSAIKQYRSSLAVLRTDGNAYETAMVNANIALAYSYKGRFDDQKVGLINLKTSCELFEDTLAELPSVEHDLFAAKICHYLGNGFGEIGIRSSGHEKAEYLQKSIKSYEASLENKSFCENAERRANTLNNLSNAIVQLCSISPRFASLDRLFYAKGCCDEALQVRVKERFPLEFAQTSTNLANAYLILSRVLSEDSATYLRLAQRKCNDAQQFRSPNEVPLDWAETKLLQGEISEEFGRVVGEGAGELYENPVKIYTEVLNVVQDANVPYYRDLAGQRLKAVQS